ncbi:hypothetical protein MKK65_07910, partial [Methylobacterium sp. J-001]|nr:hypothetical protein [Methylobacterium sp. J-001]
LITNALELHQDRPDRFVIAGPPVAVGARAALSLSLILHELATNAAKYAALPSEPVPEAMAALLRRLDTTKSQRVSDPDATKV